MFTEFILSKCLILNTTLCYMAWTLSAPNITSNLQFHLHTSSSKTVSYWPSTCYKVNIHSKHQVALYNFHTYHPYQKHFPNPPHVIKYSFSCQLFCHIHICYSTICARHYLILVCFHRLEEFFFLCIPFHLLFPLKLSVVVHLLEILALGHKLRLESCLCGVNLQNLNICRDALSQLLIIF